MNALSQKHGAMDFKETLASRNVAPNSTWLREDGSEMYVVMPDDETAIRELCERFACSYTQANAINDSPQWLRVIRLGVGVKAHASVDVMFVPFFCGQIDKGLVKRIG